MAETEQERQWRREFEADGEQAVRDSLNHRGGIATGGGDRPSICEALATEKELERERDFRLMLRIAVATFIVGFLTSFAAIAAVVMPYLIHP
jgi:hypothetical protein